MASTAFFIASFLAGAAQAQNIADASCSSTLSASYPAPSVAEGYVARLVANDLQDPRDLIFDSEGALLVVEADKGVTALTLQYGDQGCISESGRAAPIRDARLNHAIELSEDGTTLYTSDSDKAYAYPYNAMEQTTGTRVTLVQNMTNSDHVSRTLLLPRSAPGMLVITRGSMSNVDRLAEDVDTGHAQIKVFDISSLPDSPYDFTADGTLMAWGTRNEIGIDEEPITGGIYGVENSVDEMMRNGKDIHQTNPAEELNFFGYLNGTDSPNFGRNFGYPDCYTAWNLSTIPDFDGDVGDQFAIGNASPEDDADCSGDERQAPRLAFHPHMAPIDILFNEAGTAAWVSFHGSWNSEPPVGYKLSMIAFENGEPVEQSTSLTAAIDIVSNQDVTVCADEGACFSPAGLAWDPNGNLFMSSDATGEIYAILRADGSETSSAGSDDPSSIPANPGGSGSSGSGSEDLGASGGGSSDNSDESSGGGSEGAASATSMSALAVVFAALAFVM